eukprot:jgi/Ulvmu1/1761/UM117_0038.1
MLHAELRSCISDETCRMPSNVSPERCATTGNPPELPPPRVVSVRAVRAPLWPALSGAVHHGRFRCHACSKASPLMHARHGRGRRCCGMLTSGPHKSPAVVMSAQALSAPFVGRL